MKVNKSGSGSFCAPRARSTWLTFACSILLASALPTSLQAATYYWQDDSGTSVAGFTTDSPGCESEVDDGFQTTLMSAGGFNCVKFVNKVNVAAPQNIVFMIKDTVYAAATDVTGIDFTLFFGSDGGGDITARYELGYALGGVFTSFGFVDEGPHNPEELRVTDLSSISGTAPAGSHLALMISKGAPSPGILRMFTGSNEEGGGILNVTETAAGPPALEIVKRAFQTDGTPIPTGSIIPGFMEYKFLLYINNPDIARSDVSVRDLLDAAFQYQTGTIQVDNSVGECALVTCTAAEEVAIFTAVGGAAFLSDAVDGDVASITGSTIDAGNQNVANLQLDIDANKVWAILFSVKMP